MRPVTAALADGRTSGTKNLRRYPMNRQSANRQSAREQNHRALRLLLSAAAGMLMLPIGPASAATDNWTGGDGFWNFSSQWSRGVVPGSGDAVNIVFNDGVARTVTYNVTSSLGLLTVDLTGPGTVASALSMPYNNALSANGIVIGGYNGITAKLTAGRGTFTQSAATTTVNSGWDFTLGYGAGSSGTYSLGGSGALVANQSEYVGLYGAGTFNHSAGTNTIATATGFLEIGTYAGATGTYNLGGTGALVVKTNEYVGDIGTGFFNQTGGTHTFPNGTNLYLGYNASGAGGTYTLSAGNLSQTPGGNGGEYIGYRVAGAFTQSGGTNTPLGSGGLHVGTLASSTGLYTLSAGSLDSEGGEFIGDSGTGTLTQTGGTNGTGSGTSIFVGYGAGSIGTYNLSGSGSLNSGYDLDIAYGSNSSGTFDQAGGTATMAEQFNLGVNAGATGTYNLSAGSLLANGITSYSTFIGRAGTGIFNQSGGTSNFIGAGVELGDDVGGSGSFILSGGSATVAGHIFVGGSSPSSPAGTGVLTVSGSGVLTVGGVLAIVDNSGNVVNLSGGTINAAALNFNGAPARFNWTAGTLNLTTNVTWDAAAGGTTTGGAFGPALTLAANQTLMVTGNETLSGAGGFSLVIGAGGTHYVTGTLTVNSNGTIAQNAGSTLFATTITQAGGTVNGTLQNQGVFNYQSGLFNGRLLNQGSVNFGPNFTAGNGVENDAGISLGAGQTLTVNGAGLDNLGTFTLSGGTISGAGPVVNDFGGTLLARGTINSPLTNNGVLTVTGVLRLGDAGTAVNNGVVNGSGTIMGNISNAGGGSIDVAAGSALALVNDWTNLGLISMLGNGSLLSGGMITNTGTIQGLGHLNSPVANTGTIEALGGTLALGGPVQNPAGGLIRVSVGNKLLVSTGLAANAGIISLTGGTFDNNNHPLNNTGQINGYGTFASGGAGLDNHGSITFTGGITTVNGPVKNEDGKTITVAYNPAIFTGLVTNAGTGTFNIVSTTATFAGGSSGAFNGTFTNNPGAAFGKAGSGALEIDGPPTLGNSSSLGANDSGTLRFKAIVGSATVGTGVTATVSNAATLELAGSVSALSSSANRVNVTNNSAAAAGILVSGTHQQVGNIDGSGATQVNSGSDLTANHIIQDALVIGGMAGSPALVTIAASDASGDSLGQSSAESNAGLITGLFGSDGPFAAGIDPLYLNDDVVSGGLASTAPTEGSSNSVGGAAAVPEPSTIMLLVAAIATVGFGGRCRRPRGSSLNSLIRMSV
jgi:hypothetical protein